MRPQSAKAKGRRLQQETRDAVLAAFPQLEADDVRSTSMGASGADLLLSPAARKLFPYSVECKNTESLNVWKALEQAAKGAAANTTPIVVFRRNNVVAHAALPWATLLDLVRKASAYDRLFAASVTRQEPKDYVLQNQSLDGPAQ